MKCLLAVLIIGAVLATQGVPTVVICSAPGAILTNLKYSITPDDVVPGQNITIAVSGDMSEKITDASLDLTASFDTIPIYHKTLNLCTDIKCPIPAGPFAYKIDHQIPNIPIHGQVGAKAVISSVTDNKQVVCVEVKVDI